MKTKKKIKAKAIIKFNLQVNIVQKQGIKLSDHFSYGRLVKYTLPSIAMMIFTSIYGMVDGLFVSNFAGKVPFTAVNIIMPFLMIVATSFISTIKVDCPLAKSSEAPTRV